MFGQEAKRHIARWRSVKYTTVTLVREEAEVVTRKRERFSNELALFFEDVRSMMLTETPAKQVEEGKDKDAKMLTCDSGRLTTRG